MRKKTWTVAELEDEWCVLEQQDYVYVVPRDNVPDGVQPGDTVEARGSMGDDPSWVKRDRAS